MTNHVAVIDLGSNSLRVTMWRLPRQGRPEVILREMRTPRLSEGMTEDGMLQSEAIERTFDAFIELLTLIAPYDPDLIPVATAAVRNAKNRDAFLVAAKKTLGIDIRVILGKEEAFYDYIGARHTLDLQNFLLLDTGGGSFELALVREGDLLKAESIPLGAVILTETFLKKDPPSAAALYEMFDHLQNRLLNVPLVEKNMSLPLVLIGGSNRAFAKIHRHLAGKPEAELHGYPLLPSEMKDLYVSLLSKNLKERMKVPGLDSYRADIILGGMAPALCMMSLTSAKRAVVSRYGLREGLFYEYYETLHR